MPLIYLGHRYLMKGFFTKAVCLRGQPPSEIERRVGYAPGRLNGGWWLLFLEQMPGPDDFEFMAYSYMSGGVPGGHLNPPDGIAADQRLRRDGFDMAILRRRVIANIFRLSGPDRLAKVLPVDGESGPMPYPPGSGIPQWKLVRPLNFRTAAKIGPGALYSGNYV